MQLRNRKKKTFLKKLALYLLLAFLFALFLLFVTKDRMKEAIRNYATVESEQFAKAILNDTIRTETQKEFFSQKFYEIVKNEKNEIETIDFDMKTTNILLGEITKKTTASLLALEEGDLKKISVSHSFKGVNFQKYKNGVVCEIPVGLLTDHFFFANLGTVIPIRFSFVGSMDANLKSKVTPYGINNAFLELFILVEVKEKITMPLSSEQIQLSLEVPLVSQVIPGKIPIYYQGSLDENSNLFSLPIN